jgi:hypothetical protein
MLNNTNQKKAGVAALIPDRAETSAPLSEMDRSRRQTISKDTLDLNCTIYQVDIIDIHEDCFIFCRYGYDLRESTTHSCLELSSQFRDADRW